jgi:hypothetical protein
MDSDHLGQPLTQGRTGRERPILFSAPMVRALLAGIKTQTRRLVKPQPPEDCGRIYVESVHPTVIDRHGEEQPGAEIFGAFNEYGDWGVRCPYGQPGERLWVRESHLNWWKLNAEGTAREFSHVAAFRADGYELQDGEKWIPSIHMLRAASRITLEITDVRVERLQAISDADAAAEGCPCYVCGRTMDGTSEDDCHCFHRKAAASDYRDLWESINGAGSWDANPWVWAVSFRRIGTP